ncbi:hypothetical protein FC35_GL000272 [Limosilactobacillus coleohominis DSM 14060]|nr:hypothetical protein FC35_GL000272 [Limosilactobacillus coleohominis DSM 14060]
MDKSVYIWASDPHGTGQLWINLVEKAKQKYPHARLVFGGDYIDGGKYSRETLNYVMDQVDGNNAVALKGNHEDLLEKFVDYGIQTWLINGAQSTIRSLYHRTFSVEKERKLLKSSRYYTWFKQLPLQFETSNIMFVHAGVKPDGSFTDYDYKLWAREEYWWRNKTANDKTFAHNLTGLTIVTGHTPICFIHGLFDPQPSDMPPQIEEDMKNYECPVIRVQYDNEPARYFTDNGCHGGMDGHNGNVCVFDNAGNLIDIFN